MQHLTADRKQHRHVIFLALIAAVVMSTAFPLASLAETAPEPIQIAGTPVLVSGGAGNQTDPHISGSLVSYTHSGSAFSEIRYHDLETSADAAIPTGEHRDSLSDVNGTTIVFRRVYTDGSTSERPIMAFDTANPAAGLVEIDPQDGARRASPSIGGRTVAWEEQAGLSSAMTDVVTANLDTGLVTRLTNDGPTMYNREPEVSEDGTAIAWWKCPYADGGPSCNVYAASQNADGTWGTPVAITDTTGYSIQPVSNGEVVVYASDSGGDFDIWWTNLDGSNPQQLTMPGTQANPSIAGNLISFESEEAGMTQGDLFVYDLSTGRLYQVTNTPDVDEFLNDLSTTPSGSVRIVWAQPDGLSLGHNDVYALTFDLVEETSYETCVLFDQSRSYRVKSTVPIKIQLCDEQGTNLSSPDLVVTAAELVKRDNTSSPVITESPGNSNPDNNFRYDEDTQGYIYNLSTKSLSAGTWELRFTVTGDPTTYSVTFDLR